MAKKVIYLESRQIFRTPKFAKAISFILKSNKYCLVYFESASPDLQNGKQIISTALLFMTQ